MRLSQKEQLKLIGMNISEHISYKEATKSATAIRHGIKNKPNASQLKNMKLLAENVFEPLRKAMGDHPIKVHSFFRSVKLNEKIGGAKGSQHCANKGAAIDIDLDNHPNFENCQAFDYIKNHLTFDQLIFEYGNKYNPDWIHVSYNLKNNRKQILRAIFKNGKIIYLTYKD